MSKSISNKFDQILLYIHKVIAIEISKNCQLYKKQMAIFRFILDLMHQVDLIFTYKHKIKFSYFKTCQILFVAIIRQLDVDLTINKRIYKIEYQNLFGIRHVYAIS